MKNYPLLLLCIFLTPLFLHAQEKVFEVQEHTSAHLNTSPLPVFPYDPLKLLQECYPVFDILINKNGKPVVADPVYLPVDSFKSCYLKSLHRSEYIPAQINGKATASIRREVVYSYFYLTEKQPKITTLPESSWELDAETISKALGYHSISFEIKVNEKGVIDEIHLVESELFEDEIFQLRKIEQKLQEENLGKKRFNPAYENSKPIPCSLNLHLGDSSVVDPYLVQSLVRDIKTSYGIDYDLDNLDTILARMNEMLVPFPTRKVITVHLKIQYGNDRGIQSIIPISEISDSDLWILSQGLRSWLNIYRRNSVYLPFSEVIWNDAEEEDLTIQVYPQKILHVLDRDHITIKAPDIRKLILPDIYETKANAWALLEFVIDETGDCKDIRVLRSITEKTNDLLIQTLKETKFEPVIYMGKPTKAKMRIPIRQTRIPR